MNIISTKSRSGLAAAAALIAIAAASVISPVKAADQGAQQREPVRCYGVNSCKGESLCATSKHDCKGLNDCKGQGVVVKTKAECLAAGGTLTEPK
ncbi:BufA2 family periplasmic bufferin-type metallophore [Dyella sp. 2RAB6]|uniref:BufA2 family periplasmic bufferin-type metallophore n=1 Tax=Dyella sp. 2RAB6 TaxID=3232992 RepID=UPI003F921958